jgi:hypothetical protein
LGTIDEAVKIIEKTEELKWISRILHCLKRNKCNELLSIKKTLGCFYIESPAMRGLLRRLNATIQNTSGRIRYHSSWVAQSGMMREYIFRHIQINLNIFHEVSKSSWAKPMVLWSIKKM